MTTFGVRLQAAMRGRGPLCAGIDPHAALLRDWGLPDSVEGLRTFALTAAEALGPICAAVKPQSAFFERFGSRGVAVLEETIAVCRDAGAQLVLDVKRGDIGSTAQGYADAHFGPTAVAPVDAITVSPYLGFGSLTPIIDTARQYDGGAFVLALTSNPEAPEVQHARSGDRTVAGTVLDHLRELNADAPAGAGSFGAVVGATIGETAEDLDINGPLLVPGFGAQGGTLADLQRIFAGVTDRVLVSSSREVLRHGPDAAGLRAAAEQVIESLGGLA